MTSPPKNCKKPFRNSGDSGGCWNDCLAHGWWCWDLLNKPAALKTDVHNMLLCMDHVRGSSCVRCSRRASWSSSICFCCSSVMFGMWPCWMSIFSWAIALSSQARQPWFGGWAWPWVCVDGKCQKKKALLRTLSKQKTKPSQTTSGLNTCTCFRVSSNSLKIHWKIPFSAQPFCPGLCGGLRRTHNTDLVVRKASIFVVDSPCKRALLGSSLPCWNCWTVSNVFKSWTQFFHSKQLLPHLGACS